MPLSEDEQRYYWLLAEFASTETPLPMLAPEPSSAPTGEGQQWLLDILGSDTAVAAEIARADEHHTNTRTNPS